MTIPGNGLKENRYMSTDPLVRAVYHLECEGYEDEAKAVKERIAELEAQLNEARFREQAANNNMMAIVEAGKSVRLLLLKCEQKLRQNNLEVPKLEVTK
jgi:hypothetical protein